MALALQLTAQPDSVADRGLTRFPANAHLLVAAGNAREQYPVQLLVRESSGPADSADRETQKSADESFRKARSALK